MAVVMAITTYKHCIFICCRNITHNCCFYTDWWTFVLFIFLVAADSGVCILPLKERQIETCSTQEAQGFWVQSKSTTKGQTCHDDRRFLDLTLHLRIVTWLGYIKTKLYSILFTECSHSTDPPPPPQLQLPACLLSNPPSRSVSWDVPLFNTTTIVSRLKGKFLSSTSDSVPLPAECQSLFLDLDKHADPGFLPTSFSIHAIKW